MAGLYIHIPFCAKRCIYCDFFTSTNQNNKAAFIEAVCKELVLRKDYLKGEALQTIYFGGGTPSQLSASEFQQIFDAISKNYTLSDDMEVTLEANPDDLSVGYISSLRSLPFNRVSMGIQSFQPKDLIFLNRRHSKEQALQAVLNCKANSIDNISIDLIYGLPGQTLDEWTENIDEAIRLDVPHISAYHLIYENGTFLMKLKETKKITPVREELSEAFFLLLRNKLKNAGYLHYEISNFAKPDCFSKHNSSYWNGSKYLGIGPSAHSFNGESRQWNVSSMKRYLDGIVLGIPDVEKEVLDQNTRYNEYIITGLRTMWGVDLDKITTDFGVERKLFCLNQGSYYIEEGFLLNENGRLRLAQKGILISDRIMSDLLWV